MCRISIGALSMHERWDISRHAISEQLIRYNRYRGREEEESSDSDSQYSVQQPLLKLSDQVRVSAIRRPYGDTETNLLETPLLVFKRLSDEAQINYSFWKGNCRKVSLSTAFQRTLSLSRDVSFATCGMTYFLGRRIKKELSLEKTSTAIEHATYYPGAEFVLFKVPLRVRCCQSMINIIGFVGRVNWEVFHMVLRFGLSSSFLAQSHFKDQWKLVDFIIW